MQAAIESSVFKHVHHGRGTFGKRLRIPTFTIQAEDHRIPIRMCLLNLRSRLLVKSFEGIDAASVEQVLSTAALSSALTAATLFAYRRVSNTQDDKLGDKDYSEIPGQKASDVSSNPSPPSSTSEVWQDAWAPFSDPDDDNNSLGDSLEYDTEPISQPLLWIQGIKPNARRELLSTCLKTVQSHIDSLPLDPDTIAHAEAWPSVVIAMLAYCTVTAAQAWLGYVPDSLARACQAQINNCFGNTTTTTTTTAEEVQGDKEVAPGTPWYALDERIELYCSVLRLLRSEIAAGPQQDLHLSRKRIPLSQIEEATSLSVSSFELFAQGTKETGAPPNVGQPRGWRATQAGTRSFSQLLSIAPNVLQDMAVLISDAVTEAYLQEATLGRWQPAPVPEMIHSRATRRKRSSSNETQNSRSLSPVENNNNSNSNNGVESDVYGNAFFSGNGIERHYLDFAMASATARDSRSSSSSSSSSNRKIPLEVAWWPSYVHPRLSSTRQLQRFSNRLAAARWADRTFLSVAAAFDDRLPLFTLAPPSLKSPRLSSRRDKSPEESPKTATSAHGAPALRIRRIPIRRAVEIGALTGSRYAASLVLELVDVAAPVLKSLWERAAAVLGWVLVRGVGWCIAMVLQGIRQGAETLNPKP